MLLPIAPKPLEATAMRGLWRRIPRAAATLALTALVGMSAPAVVTASPQQAPNSRVVLDLPPGYTPSPLFSGFQNDASGVSFIILEAPFGEYDKMAAGFSAEELAKRGITDAKKAELARTDPHVYMRAHQKSRRRRLRQVLCPLPHRRSDDPRFGQRAAALARGRQRQAGGRRARAGERQDDRKAGGARSFFALLSRAVQGGRARWSAPARSIRSTGASSRSAPARRARRSWWRHRSTSGP